jgi:hypothetical protein
VIDTDTLLFANGDQLTGDIASLANEKLTLKTADADFVVDRSRVAAVVFRRDSPGEKPSVGDKPPVSGLKIWVGPRDGSRLLARGFVAEGESATVELAGGGAIKLQLDSIVGLQPIGGDVAYLSDIDDAGYRHIPFLSLGWGYERDRNVTGGPLMVNGRRYIKGLGMHSAARITYNLDREYREFQAEVAIDDSTAGRGSAVCRIFADDGSGKWQLKSESAVLRGGEKQIQIRADLTGAKRLSLLVEFADRADEQDHVDWLDARLIK